MVPTSSASAPKIDGVVHAGPEIAELQRQSELTAGRSSRARRNVGTGVVSGSLWTIAGYGAGQVIRLAGNIVVSRLVLPEAFGVMALVNIFLQGLTMFSDVGIEPAIVQNRRGDEPRFYNTAWTVQVLRGLVLFAASCLLAWPFALVYDEPRLTWLIPAGGAATLLAGWNSTALFAARRHLMLAPLTLLDLAAQASGVGVMCGLAWQGAGVWSMIGGTLATAAVTLVGSHVLLSGHANRFAWERSAVGELVRFGKWILVSTIVTFCALQIDRLMLGRLITKEQLGIYSVAAAVALLPNMILQTLAGAVLYPLLARYARNSAELVRRNFAATREVLSALGTFLVVGVVLEAETFFSLLYDDRYGAAADIARRLACVSGIMMLGTMLERVPQALGDTRSLAVFNFTKVASAAVCAPLGFYAFGGLEGFLAGYTVALILGHCMLLRLLAWHGVSVWRDDVRTVAVAVLVAWAGSLIAQAFYDWHGPAAREIAAWTYLAGVGCWALGATQRLRHLSEGG